MQAQRAPHRQKGFANQPSKTSARKIPAEGPWRPPQKVTTRSFAVERLGDARNSALAPLHPYRVLPLPLTKMQCRRRKFRHNPHAKRSFCPHRATQSGSAAVLGLIVKAGECFSNQRAKCLHLVGQPLSCAGRHYGLSKCKPSFHRPSKAPYSRRILWLIVYLTSTTAMKPGWGLISDLP